MANESIYYVFSRRFPCLRAKLTQRDRLLDSQVYLTAINPNEVRLVVRHSDHRCPSAILFLAALLRPHTHQFPLFFNQDSIEIPHAFYSFDFGPRRLPPPPGLSFGFNVLFAIPIRSKAMLAIQLARFIFQVSEEVTSVSAGLKFWDLTFRVDRNTVFGTLQFETRSRHEKLQMEAKDVTNSLTVFHPRTSECTFYRELSGISLPEDVVSTYMQQINKSLSELTTEGDIYKWQS